MAFLLAPGAVAIDVLPSPRIGKGEVVRPDAHHWPVFLVLPVRVECLDTDRLAESPRPWRCSGQQGPRDGAQWVKEEVEDGKAQLVRQDLV